LPREFAKQSRGGGNGRDEGVSELGSHALRSRKRLLPPHWAQHGGRLHVLEECLALLVGVLHRASIA
jgi:hypothetical protein